MRALAASGLLLILALPGPGEATVITRRIVPGDLARGAARVLHARVVDVRSGRDASGLPTTWVTLDVTRTLKGGGGPTLTFKQFGVASPLADGTLTRVPGMVHYRAGDEVVLFLHGESAHGFTSPVGFAQGVYRVSRTGRRAVVRDEAGGPVRDLDAFLDEVARPSDD